MIRFPLNTPPRQVKIGLLLTSETQPEWLARIISMLAGLSVVDLALILPENESLQDREIEAQPLMPGFVGNAFGKLDRLLHSRKVIGGKMVRIQADKYGARIVRGMTFNREGAVDLSPDGAELLKAFDPELLLYFDAPPLADAVHRVPPLGVCSFGSRFLEWRTAARVRKFVVALSEQGPDALRRDPYAAEFSLKENWTVRPAPGGRLVRLAIRLLAGKLHNRIGDEFQVKRWEIGYRLSDEPVLDTKAFDVVHHLKPPTGFIYGDPFPIQNDGRCTLFFEEMPADDVHDHLTGHISAVEIDPSSGAAGPVRKVLERPYHLSFPFVFSWNGAYYMVPETHQNRHIELYRCVAFPDRWELEKVLFEGVEAVDTVLFEQEGRWWLFTCLPHRPDGHESVQPHDYELNLFSAASPLGPWSAHPKNPVRTGAIGVRSAGKIFTHAGHLYRPGQDCSIRYGYGVVFNRIDELSPEDYRETADSALSPDGSPEILGVHTFNLCETLQVVDFKRKRKRFFE